MNAKRVKELRRCMGEYLTKFPTALPVGYRRVAGEGSQVYSPRRTFYRRLKRTVEAYGLSRCAIRTEIFSMLGEEQT